MDSHIASHSARHELECYDLDAAVSQGKSYIEEVSVIGTRPDVLLRLGRAPVLKVSLFARFGHWKLISYLTIA